jgi:hypothetical protein
MRADYVLIDIVGTIYPTGLCRVASDPDGKHLRNKDIFRRNARATRHSQLDLQAVQELQQIVVGPEAG